MTEQPADPIDAMAKLLDLELPEACRPGVAANLDLLAQHVRILDDYLKGEDAA